LEVERDSIPPEPSLELRDPLLVYVELLLLMLYFGCEPLSILDCTHID
jgi:hypothetical protein